MDGRPEYGSASSYDLEETGPGEKGKRKGGDFYKSDSRCAREKNTALRSSADASGDPGVDGG
tara:strand:- start:14 stop:199 length:186 start_codon:yes stop_codon:yes gene_type:complete